MCKCGGKLITLGGIFIDELEADSEPYENGVSEELTDEDAYFVDGLSIELNLNACSSCKKVYFYFNDENFEKGVHV